MRPLTSEPPAAAPPASFSNATILPLEIWEIVVGNLWQDDLKNTRLVNGSFHELATPLLFRRVVLSVSDCNPEQIKEISNHSVLCEHVEELCVDLASYVNLEGPQHYANLLSRHFGAVTGRLFATGPLSGDALHRVLTTEVSQPLGQEYLSGLPRREMIAGYDSWCAKSQIQATLLQNRAQYFRTWLRTCLISFHKLRSVCTSTRWTPAEDQVDRLASYLKAHLPTETFGLIAELNLPGTGEAGHRVGMFVAPGAAARQLPFMTMAPYPAISGGIGADHVTQVVRGLLRTLHGQSIGLANLSLPGSDTLSKHTQLSDRHASVPASTFLSDEVTPDEDLSTNPVLPSLLYLRSLELQIDPVHGLLTSGQPQMFWPRLRGALQAMKSVESLSLGFDTMEGPDFIYMACPWWTWSLHDTLLGCGLRNTEFDTEDASASNYGPDYERNPYPFIQYMKRLHRNASWPPQPEVTGPYFTSPDGAQTMYVSSETFVQDVITSMDIPIEHVSGAPKFLGRPMCQCWGSDPESAIQPNPWPMLKHLSHWNMSAMKGDLVRLVRTISSSLRSLELDNVFYSDYYRETDNDTAAITNASQAGESQGFGPSEQASSGHEPYPADAWVDTIDVLASELNLKSCEILLGEHDQECVIKKLQGHYIGCWDCGLPIEKLMSRYVVEESGQPGFAMYVTGDGRPLNTKYSDHHGEEETEAGTDPVNDQEAEKQVDKNVEEALDGNVTGEDVGS